MEKSSIACYDQWNISNNDSYLITRSIRLLCYMFAKDTEDWSLIQNMMK